MLILSVWDPRASGSLKRLNIINKYSHVYNLSVLTAVYFYPIRLPLRKSSNNECWIERITMFKIYSIEYKNTLLNPP